MKFEEIEKLQQQLLENGSELKETRRELADCENQIEMMKQQKDPEMIQAFKPQLAILESKKQALEQKIRPLQNQASELGIALQKLQRR